MPSLRNRTWNSIYESRPNSEDASLVDDFYVPALERSVRYDRIAGYFSSSALAVATRGLDALVENDGEMRLVVGTELYETDRPVLEALTDELGDSLDDLDDERLDAQLQILARLLREDRLHIKVAVAREESWRTFHPKMGVFHDGEHTLSFEGSLNETVGGWQKNYERFKVHRSWVDEQANYVESDVETFDRLWTDAHPYVEVYDLPEAIEKRIIDWRDPDSESELEAAIQIARGEAPPTERDKANVVADGPLSPGGLALAEEGSTITPWPHQRVVSDTLVNTYPNSFLLCDEVGLGKTIEAGLTLSRLGLTGELETGLLLVPASLTIQWQEELWEKFNLNAYRFDRGSNYEYAFIDPFGNEHSPPSSADLGLDADQRQQAWVESPIWRFLHQQQHEQRQQDGAVGIEGPTIIIMSWHTARLEDRWEQVAPADGGVPRTRASVPASRRGRPSDGREGVWDAVVVDEAHNARDGSNFYDLLERLREHTQCYYLLTATPMQLHAGELYDLMSLLDLPGQWDDKASFEEFFETRQALTTAFEKELDGGATDAGSGDDESWSAQATLDNRYQDRLSTERHLSDRLFDRIASALELADEHGRTLAKERVLTACTLARDYGEEYDGYVETFDRAIDQYDVDTFEEEDKKLKYLLSPEWKLDDEWLTASRNDRLNALDEITEGGWRVVRDVLAESTPVDALIHRNTRETLRKYEQVGLLGETVPDRKPEQREIELTDETRAVYDRIREYTKKFYKLAQQSSEAETRAIGFVMTTYRQRLTSSIYAISESLQNRLETLRGQRAVLKGTQQAAERTQRDSRQVLLETVSEYDLDDIDALDELDGGLEDADLADVMPSVTDAGLDLLEQEIEELESFVSVLARIDHDPKINQLRDDLQDLDWEGRNRVIIFTQYADTMDFIRESLVSVHRETVASYSGRGGELYDSESETWTQVGKERVKREFSADDGQVDLLVCTDSASEGLNLQECGTLINYDLPWNPMRVEQRIGRIDRIGQQYDDIKIINYSYKDTVEIDIYDRLDDRIDLFENVVGDMQPILSDVNERIRSATLEAEDERRIVEQADHELAERIEAQEQSDRVDIGSSLDTVETPVKQEVIEEAKLDAWQSYEHPDLTAVGDDDYEYPPPFVTEGVERVLTESQTLADVGVEFTPVAEIGVEPDETAYPADFEFEDRTYRLTDHEARIDLRQSHTEGTVSAALAPNDDAVVVTFSSECAETYPSIRYFAPGSPLLGQLVALLRDESDAPTRLDRRVEYREARRGVPVICGRGRDGDFGRLSADGSVSESQQARLFSVWLDSFLENRERATN